jgi:hypothetical protein
MSKKIKYIAFYNLEELKQNRASAPSAIDKINYIINSLNKLEYNVDLYSPSWIVGKGFSFEKKIIKNNNVFNFAPTLGSANKITTYLSILISWIWVLKIILLNTKKNETIIVYHSPWLSLPILIAKRIKKIKVILEIEEIYQDVENFSSFLNKQELKIIDKANAYILSTEQLIKRIKNEKPHIVLYGNYKIYEKKQENKFRDDKIHLLYAGIIDKHKAGAFNAIEAAAFLDNRFVLHVLGFGDVEDLQNRIQEINKVSNCLISYEGLKTGVEYIDFCQKCHLGLSTQNTQGDYVNTSFPSKILSYLGMGLRVLSSDIKCVSESKIGKLMFYYSEDNPQEIAKKINSIDFTSEYNSIELLKNLDKEFVLKLNAILK